MINLWFRTASVLMMLGVILGAFGAHGLKTRLTPENLEIYKTAVFYHFVHALGLFIVAQVAATNRSMTLVGLCFVFGILLFSGSLYLLAVTNLRWLGAVTPLGGLLFICGWAFLAFSK